MIDNETKFIHKDESEKYNKSIKDRYLGLLKELFEARDSYADTMVKLKEIYAMLKSIDIKDLYRKNIKSFETYFGYRNLYYGTEPQVQILRSKINKEFKEMAKKKDDLGLELPEGFGTGEIWRKKYLMNEVRLYHENKEEERLRKEELKELKEELKALEKLLEEEVSDKERKELLREKIEVYKDLMEEVEKLPYNKEKLKSVEQIYKNLEGQEKIKQLYLVLLNKQPHEKDAFKKEVHAKRIRVLDELLKKVKPTQERGR